MMMMTMSSIPDCGDGGKSTGATGPPVFMCFPVCAASRGISIQTTTLVVSAGDCRSDGIVLAVMDSDDDDIGAATTAWR